MSLDRYHYQVRSANSSLQLAMPDLDDQMAVKPQRSPLTKRVDQIRYESGGRFNNNPWASPPEFLKVFGDLDVSPGGRVEFECVLIGNPRPRITWFFNSRKIPFTDYQIQNTCDTCRLIIPRVRREHYGRYTIVAENELGQATCTADVRGVYYN